MGRQAGAAQLQDMATKEGKAAACLLPSSLLIQTRHLLNKKAPHSVDNIGNHNCRQVLDVRQAMSIKGLPQVPRSCPLFLVKSSNCYFSRQGWQQANPGCIPVQSALLQVHAPIEMRRFPPKKHTHR